MFIDVSLGWRRLNGGGKVEGARREGGGKGWSYAFYPTLPHVIKTLVMLLIAG